MHGSALRSRVSLTAFRGFPGRHFLPSGLSSRAFAGFFLDFFCAATYFFFFAAFLAFFLAITHLRKRLRNETLRPIEPVRAIQAPEFSR
jgi:hypothetical protein